MGKKFKLALPSLLFFTTLCAGEKVLNEREHYPLTSHFQVTPKVNVVTGEYQEEECDFVVHGSSPLSLRRFYNHRAHYDPCYTFWRFNPEHFSVANFEYKENDQKKFVAFGEESGNMVQCDQHIEKGRYGFNLSSTSSFVQLRPYGHPLNCKVSFSKTNFQEDRDCFKWEGEIVDGMGGRKKFLTTTHSWLRSVKMYTNPRNRDEAYIVTPNVWTPYQLPILEERRPDGTYLCYTYSMMSKDEAYPGYYRITSITALNSTKTKELGKIKLHYEMPGMQKYKTWIKSIDVEGSCGRRVKYNYESLDILVNGRHLQSLDSITTPSGKEKIHYDQKGRVIKISRPQGRYFRTEYDDDTGRVKAQYAPVGPDSKEVRIAAFTYQEKKCTKVKNALNHEVRYNFDANKRITSCEVYDSRGVLYKVDRYQWDPKSGNLLSKREEDGAKRLFLERSYIYDERYNCIEERVGDGKESYSIYRAYSNDGFNLKIMERDDFSGERRYSYVPETNLLSSELLYEGDKIRKRLFHFYDDCAIRIKTIEDDGVTIDPDDLSHVTYRMITTIQPKAQAPCLGLPEVIEKKTLDQRGHEISLGKIVYTYTPFGKVVKEERYDGEGHLYSTVENSYDKQERLSATINALGEKREFSYDENHNLVMEKGPDNFIRKWTYDKANRQKSEEDEGGLIKTKTYDVLSRVVAARDEAGFTTEYEYDVLDRIVTVRHPDGSVEKKEYDNLGRVVKEIDCQGGVTEKWYHFQGLPTKILYPDGTSEEFSYRADGKMVSMVDKHGAVRRYSYDLFGHVVEEAHDQFKKSATFSPFVELSSTDGEGLTTYYTYDCAGRKVAEKVGLCTTTFAYDTFGREILRTQGHTKIKTHYDPLNRPLKKSIYVEEELMQEERQEYDSFGNRCQKITSQGSYVDKYDSHGKLLWQKDPLGQITSFTYSYSGGLVKTTHYPNATEKIELHDCRGRQKESYITNPAGKVVQRTRREFDAGGNVTLREEEVFNGIEPIKKVVNRAIFGPCNRLEKVVEAGVKTTTFEYDERGRLKSIIKPSFTKIYYHYDTLGRVLECTSSDFHTLYTYDRCNRLIKAEDLKTKEKTERLYDLSGNLIEERLANGKVLKYKYDDFNRRVGVELPDRSTIQYSYKGKWLYTVARGHITHTYKKRNLEGEVTHSILPLNQGEVVVERDEMGRWKRSSSPYQEIRCEYDMMGNLTSYTDQKQECAYSYDCLNQLIQENKNHYTYDSLYNRTSVNGTPTTYNDLSQIEGFTYDAQGNLLDDGQYSYKYDNQDRLVEVRQGNRKTVYTYDAFHRRQTKSHYIDDIGVEQESYLWDGENEIGMMDYDGYLRELRILGEGMGAEIGAAVLMEINGYSYTPLHNQRGDVTALLYKGAVYEGYHYTAFGEEESKLKLSPWGFASKRKDFETGLIYFGRRYYSPRLGRWMTADPQGYMDGPNLYAYVHNCPLTRLDFYGLFENPYTNSTSALDCGRRALMNISEAVEWFGRHCIPIPGVRDVVESIGRWGAGHGPLFAPCQYRENHNQVYRIEGKSIENTTITYKNGMNTSLTQAIDETKKISETHGNVAVTLLYNGSQGFIVDLIHCALAKLGLITPVEKMAAQFYINEYNQNPNTTFICYAHSQGVTHLYNTGKIVSSDIRETMDARCFGSASLIPKNYFGDVNHYISAIDLVPITDPINYCRALLQRESSNVHFLAPNCFSPLREHSINGPTYSGTLILLGSDFRDAMVK